jgi:hypothetical protein
MVPKIFCSQKSAWVRTQKPAKNLAPTKIFYRQKLLGFNNNLTKKY